MGWRYRRITGRLRLLRQVRAPQPHKGRVALTPVLLEGLEPGFGGGLVGDGIDQSQVLGQRPPVLL